MTVRPIDREAILQRHWRLFVRDALDAPHEAFAFDRAKATGRFTHAPRVVTAVSGGQVAFYPEGQDARKMVTPVSDFMAWAEIARVIRA